MVLLPHLWVDSIQKNALVDDAPKVQLQHTQESNVTASTLTTDVQDPRRSARTALKVLALIASLLVVATLTVTASRAAFTATTDNGVNTFTAGTVALTDDDSGAVMFNLGAMAPGSTATRCINVTYNGSLTSNVRLYGTVAGSGLAPYLNTVIEVGSGAAGGNTFDCTGFVAPTNLHTGTLAAFGAANTNYSNGLGGWTGATTGATRSYRISATLQDNNAAQGLGATATFTWEAQNQ